MDNLDSKASAIINGFCDNPEPFAIVQGAKKDEAYLLSGPMVSCDRVADIPKRTCLSRGENIICDTVGVIPFSQISELGYEAKEDDVKIRCMQVEEQTRVDIGDLLVAIPDEPIRTENGFNSEDSDEEYADKVRRIIEEEIKEGNACNVVTSANITGKIEQMSPLKALNIVKRMLRDEFGAYMTFFFYDGEKYHIGASPERNITVRDGSVGMNPISGTYFKEEKIDRERFIQFLRDPKEINELFMCMDEELKQMSTICEKGGRIIGPALKEMSHLVHTEYQLEGRSNKDSRESLRLSMHAPTVTGSPIKSACHIINKHEQESREYYSGEFFITYFDEGGNEILDSAIMIRTVMVLPNGRIVLRAGASIVRDSDPEKEAKERNTKAASAVRAITGPSSQKSQPQLPSIVDEEINRILVERNKLLNSFLFENQECVDNSVPELQDKTITIIDNEDSFSCMLSHMIDSAGAQAQVVSYKDFDETKDSADIVIVGPGPGNPLNKDEEKMQTLEKTTAALIKSGRTFLSVCLGHQSICKELGFDIIKKKDPSQGIQKQIDFFGKKEDVAFYNTFAAINGKNIDDVDVCSDEETGEIHALRGKNFSSFQFHAESILSHNGFTILTEELKRLVKSGQ
ncbi:anthranilate synthase family protein [Patescibacteria group bacterium]|nr:anthranilate synthase family protein [Patescibacteria group bacterium]